MVRNKKTDNNVDLACPHTIKKFELIEAYVRDWAHKLLNYENCNEIVFIDCMCNSGIIKTLMTKMFSGRLFALQN